MVLKLWSPTEQHQHQQGRCWKCTFSGSSPDVGMPRLLGVQLQGQCHRSPPAILTHTAAGQPVQPIKKDLTDETQEEHTNSCFPPGHPGKRKVMETWRAISKCLSPLPPFSQAAAITIIIRKIFLIWSGTLLCRAPTLHASFLSHRSSKPPNPFQVS